MEVIYDLDTEARALCEKIHLNMVRASTVGTHPRFIRMIRELILERMNPDSPRSYLGTRGTQADICPADCCRIVSI
jgi:ferrochelatase